LLVGLRRRCRHDGRNVWLCSYPCGETTPSLWGPPRQLRGRLRLVHLGVVGSERRAGPPRLRDQILQEEDVVAQVRRVAELVGERLVAGDQVDVFVLVLDRLAESVQVAVA